MKKKWLYTIVVVACCVGVCILISFEKKVLSLQGKKAAYIMVTLAGVAGILVLHTNEDELKEACKSTSYTDTFPPM